MSEQKRFYVTRLDGYPIRPETSGRYSVGRDGEQMQTEFLVIDRDYCHEAVWTSQLQTKQHREIFRKLAHAIARDLNERGELRPKLARRIRDTDTSRRTHARARLRWYLERRARLRAADDEAERRLEEE